MQNRARPESESPPPAAGPGALFVLAGAAFTLLLGMWITLQGGLAPASPDGFARMLLTLIFAAPLVAGQWLAAAGWGWAIGRVLGLRGPNGWIGRLGAGLAALLFVDAGLGLVGLLNAYTTWGMAGAGAAILAWRVTRPEVQERMHRHGPLQLSWAMIVGGFPLGVLLVASTCPVGSLWRIEALGYDALSYHLQLPREWLEGGRIVGLQHNVYSYLPNLVEAGYMAIGAMAGSMVEGVYAAQMFHASAALFTAAAVAGIVRAALSGVGGEAAQQSLQPAAKVSAGLAGALVLALPWTLVVASLAYDEMFGLAFAAAAIAVLFSPAGRGWRAAGLAGFLAGAATLAKLPMGPMLALPIGLTILLGLDVAKSPSAEPSPPPRRFPAAISRAGIALLVGLLTLSPYFIRNAAWTASAGHPGNPVFPFAAKRLGEAHWTDFEVNRWNAAHGHAADGTSPWRNFDRQWLRHPGYGALGGVKASFIGKERFNIARFQREYGFPLIPLAAVLGFAAAMATPGLRRLALAMAIFLACQVVFWMTGTHQQSRFLVPSLLPLCVLVGFALHFVARMVERWLSPSAQERALFLPGSLAPAMGVALVTACAVNGLNLLRVQTIVDLNVWEISGAMVMPDRVERLGPDDTVLGNHPLSHLPRESLTYSLGDCSRLLLIRRPIYYETAFDRCLLGQVMRAHGHDARAVAADLRERGITHLWVAWTELDRLHQTYGFDPDVTPASVAALAKDWNVIIDGGRIYTLFAVPR